MSANPVGYTASKRQLLTRLRRIEGQVRGLHRLVDEDTYASTSSRRSPPRRAPWRASRSSSSANTSATVFTTPCSKVVKQPRRGSWKPSRRSLAWCDRDRACRRRRLGGQARPGCPGELLDVLGNVVGPDRRLFRFGCRPRVRIGARDLRPPRSAYRPCRDPRVAVWNGVVVLFVCSGGDDSDPDRSGSRCGRGDDLPRRVDEPGAGARPSCCSPSSDGNSSPASSSGAS